MDFGDFCGIRDASNLNCRVCIATDNNKNVNEHINFLSA